MRKHSHGTAFYRGEVDGGGIKKHVKSDHDFSHDETNFVVVDLIVEMHSAAHGRDIFGNKIGNDPFEREDKWKRS